MNQLKFAKNNVEEIANNINFCNLVVILSVKKLINEKTIASNDKKTCMLAIVV